MCVLCCRQSEYLELFYPLLKAQAETVSKTLCWAAYEQPAEYSIDYVV